MHRTWKRRGLNDNGNGKYSVSCTLCLWVQKHFYEVSCVIGIIVCNYLISQAIQASNVCSMIRVFLLIILQLIRHIGMQSACKINTLALVWAFVELYSNNQNCLAQFPFEVVPACVLQSVNNNDNTKEKPKKLSSCLSKPRASMLILKKKKTVTSEAHRDLYSCKVSKEPTEGQLQFRLL